MTEETAANQNQGSQEPSSNADQQANQNQGSEFSVPEGYADRDWAKNIKSSDDLWKQMDNAQSLIGKRPSVIPSAESSDEDWDKFYDDAGRPKDKGDYTFSDLKDIEGMPEDVDLTPYQERARDIFHAAGLNQKQADRLWEKYIRAELETSNADLKNHAEKTKELDAKFDELTKSHFGEDYEKVESQVLESMADSPQEFRDAIANADPSTQVAVIFEINRINKELSALREKYGDEDGLNKGDNGAGGSDINDVRKELATLRSSAAAKDFLHPENKKAMARIEELSGMVSRHYAKK